MELIGNMIKSVLRGTTPRAVFLGFATLFCVSGFVYSMMLGDMLRFPDEHDYIVLARHLAALDGYTFDGQIPTAYRPPGYPLVLAPIIALVDSVHAARLLNFVMLALAAYMLAGLVRDRRSTVDHWHHASFVLMLTFTYPVLYYTSGTLFPQISIALALTLTIVLLQRESNSIVLATAIGVLVALTAQISPTTLVIVPLTLMFATWSRHWSSSRVAIMAIAITLVFGGWFARNVVVINEPILFSKNLAENLDNSVLMEAPLEPGEERPQASVMDYAVERLEQTFGSPMDYFGRFINFFDFSNELAVDTEKSPIRDRIMFVTYYSLLLMVLVRLAFARQLPLSQAEWLVLILYVGTGLFHALVIPRIRYRLPFDFLLLLPIAKLALYSFLSRRRRLSNNDLTGGSGAARR